MAPYIHQSTTIIVKTHCFSIFLSFSPSKYSHKQTNLRRICVRDGRWKVDERLLLRNAYNIKALTNLFTNNGRWLCVEGELRGKLSECCSRFYSMHPRRMHLWKVNRVPSNRNRPNLWVCNAIAVEMKCELHSFDAQWLWDCWCYVRLLCVE